MAGRWVQLKTTKVIIVKGAARQCRPGEWVQVGKMDAERWVAEGAAVWATPHSANNEPLPNYSAGFLVVDPDDKEAVEYHAGLVSSIKLDIAVLDGDWLPFERTIIWTPSAPLRAELVPTGLRLLDKWQVVAPLGDYKTLARDAGTPDDRARTERMIRDLRCLLYDTRLMFVRRSGDTQELMQTWSNERSNGGDARLAFLRALYATKPIVCAAPHSWVAGRDYVDV